MSAFLSTNLRDELARLVANFEHRGQSVQPLSVGGRGAFGKLTVGAAAPTLPDPGGYDEPVPKDFCGQDGCGGLRDVKGFLDQIGYPPCRVWGAEPPGGRDMQGCPTKKKLCIIPMPLFDTIPAATTGQIYEPLAKVWYWPLMLVDNGSGADVTIDALTYTGDSVVENGEGSGAFSPSALFPSDGNYSVMPGLPAFNNKVGIQFELANDGVGAEDLDAMFIGVSIRN